MKHDDHVEGNIGPRVLEIGFDCDPIDETAVKQKLSSISSFISRTAVHDFYRWGIRVSLHPVIQNRSGKEMVGEVCRKLGIKPGTPVGWSDSSESVS